MLHALLQSILVSVVAATTHKSLCTYTHLLQPVARACQQSLCQPICVVHAVVRQQVQVLVVSPASRWQGQRGQEQARGHTRNKQQHRLSAGLSLPHLLYACTAARGSRCPQSPSNLTLSVALTRCTPSFLQRTSPATVNQPQGQLVR